MVHPEESSIRKDGSPEPEVRTEPESGTGNRIRHHESVHPVRYKEGPGLEDSTICRIRLQLSILVFLPSPPSASVLQFS